MPSDKTMQVGRGDVKILVVDDEKIIRNLLIHLLEQLVFAVLSAGNADEALKIFADEKDQIKLVITDIVMSGMNGYILARKLKEERPALDIIFMSGDMSQLSSIIDKPLHNIHYLKKPFKLAEVKAKVLEVLQTKQG